MSTYDQPDFRKQPFPTGPGSPTGPGFETGPGLGTGSGFETGSGFGTGPGFGELQPGGVFIFGRPGNLDTDQSLRSYLLLRAITRSVRNTVLWLGLIVLALGVAVWFAGLKVLGILIGLVGLAVLIVRGAFTSLGRRFGSGPVDPRVDRLVARTGKGLRSELRRVGLPGTPWATLLIALRLTRSGRRRQTMQSLTKVDLAKVVPVSQVDELHLLLQSTRTV